MPRQWLRAAAVLFGSLMVCAAVLVGTFALIGLSKQVRENCQARKQLRSDVAYVLNLARPTQSTLEHLSPAQQDRILTFYGQAIGRILRSPC